MFRLLIDGTVETQRDPAEQFPALETSLIDNWDEQRHFGQLEERHLEGERLHPGGSAVRVSLGSRFGPAELLSGLRQEEDFDTGVRRPIGRPTP